MSECPISGCIEKPVPGQLMCLAHWRAVPSMHKDATWRAWRALRHRAGRPAGTLRADLSAYRVVRTAAIEAVQGRCACAVSAAASSAASASSGVAGESKASAAQSAIEGAKAKGNSHRVSSRHLGLEPHTHERTQAESGHAGIAFCAVKVFCSKTALETPERLGSEITP